MATCAAVVVMAVVGAGAAVARPLPGMRPDDAPGTSRQATPATAKLLPGPTAPDATGAVAEPRPAAAKPVPEPVPEPKPPVTPIGYDVSWPQCGDRLPTGQAFAIIGVTGGLANNTNPCLAEQLTWAETSTGGTGQPAAALYVNTANPGLGGSWWPTSNTYAGTAIDNPYGTCEGANDVACAFIYGWAKAFDDVHLRGVEDPGLYLWWLDVETDNTWQADTVANAADLEGMTTYFESIGAKVGIYSNGSQWSQIVGTVGPESNLYDLPSWLAGARTLTGAESNCALPPLTAGGTVSLTQYVAKDLDHNHSCV